MKTGTRWIFNLIKNKYNQVQLSNYDDDIDFLLFDISSIIFEIMYNN